MGAARDAHPRMGKYRVIRRLAEGGMGEIFLGLAEGESGFEKVVVLKRILQQRVGERDAVQMFMDEARLMAALNHPNVVQVYDFGSAAGGHFFAMEYVHGEDLGQIMKAATLAGRALPLELAIGVIAEAAAGLHYAHDKRGPDGTPLQIVHRDISPSNVLVSYEGGVKLTDFGIAKWTKRQTETRYGAIKGKVAYMSPEQCRAGTCDRRSDVFGLGILLYELTTGTRLYQGASDFAVLEQIVNSDAPRPSSRRPGYPAAVEQIVMRALARDPEHRQQTARELQLQLEEYALENKLMISAMARAAEMDSLFGKKIEAWREAAHAGRSLGEHLAAERTPTRPEAPGTYLIEGPAPARRGPLLALVAALIIVGAVSAFSLRRTAPRPPAPAQAALGPAATTAWSVTPLPERTPDAAPKKVEVPPARPPASRRIHRRAAEGPARSTAPTPGKKLWDPDSIYLP
jgi:eukaryotic-like serine/threonine-protein kinase